MRIALTGDVMLGRLVDQHVIQNRSVRPLELWGDVLPIMLGADCRLINLECVISKQGEEWHPTTKEFHFRADPRALEFLQAAKIDGVTLANNHVLDYGADALLDCLTLLDRADIKRTGAGATLEEACVPALFRLRDARVAVRHRRVSDLLADDMLSRMRSNPAAPSPSSFLSRPAAVPTRWHG